MKFNYKLFGLVMFVMLICCVSAASATDVDNITVPDDADIIIDDVADSVDAVEQGDVIERSNDPSPQIRVMVTVTPDNYDNYFNTVTGYTTTSNDLRFKGTFNSYSFGNFKINESVNIIASAATFNDIGFDLLKSDITLKGATIVMNAPANTSCIAIDIENSNNTKLLDNKITYTCGHDNGAYYNYVIKAKNSENLTISGNKINATLPLKTVDWYAPGISADFVAGVAIQDCDKINFTRNTVNITGNRRVGSSPTLDAIMIVSSDNSYVGDNKVYLVDTVTPNNQYSYVYGIDVYQCYNITINNNTVDMNGNQSGGQIGGNGTGAAYCLQLTGSHVGVTISNNTLTTKNNGPNLGIYSQNYYGTTNLTIYGNTISVTGKAGFDPWSLVSGMELQDTYAKVYNNTISVNNTAGYAPNICAYGISYSQTTNGNHEYDIENNTVTVYNGDYAVYLQGTATTGIIQGNNLTAIGNTTHTGNGAIYAPGITPGSNP